VLVFNFLNKPEDDLEDLLDDEEDVDEVLIAEEK
jgi:hypothetical protein